MGGVRIYVRSGILCSMREDLSLFQEGCVATIFIETHSGDLIGEVYRVTATGTRPLLDKYHYYIPEKSPYTLTLK